MQTRISNKRRKGIYEIDDSRLIIPVNYSKDTIDKVSVVYGTHTHIQTAVDCKNTIRII